MRTREASEGRNWNRNREIYRCYYCDNLERRRVEKEEEEAVLGFKAFLTFFYVYRWSSGNISDGGCEENNILREVTFVHKNTMPKSGRLVLSLFSWALQRLYWFPFIALYHKIHWKSHFAETSEARGGGVKTVSLSFFWVMWIFIESTCTHIHDGLNVLKSWGNL